jgi:hypothetical protein
MCAFPLHVWTLILAFRDFSWVAERTNAWDAVGVASYGMIFAFIESLVVSLVAVLFGFLISTKWKEDRRIALLSYLVIIVALWEIVSQLYYLQGFSIPGSIYLFLIHSGHPVRYLYAAALVLALLTIGPPVYLLLRSDKALRLARESIDRLSLLTSFYLFLDLAGLVIVIVRNL